MCEYARSVKDGIGNVLIGRSEDPNDRDMLRQLYKAADQVIAGVNYQDTVAVNGAAKAFAKRVGDIFRHEGKAAQAEEMVRDIAKTMCLIAQSKGQHPGSSRRTFAKVLNLFNSLCNLVRTRVNQAGIYE